ncbi:hypothetical protein ALI144C_44780 [Actinosynnema sp. ALI-1.44]|uniref:RapZ C-terminal domain-containing protein n=1 Tax=Actinosynnema sp. ALI-1.44 TaxID=1933779 RepID=UPI00097CA230|nr:RNase adapter RapZ [Actinosynnema sp. ALI-1.44]ONI73070.1 hypothetical protein ALI144C_44780 [Actinosynnema sp. ALI-1.44]
MIIGLPGNPHLRIMSFGYDSDRVPDVDVLVDARDWFPEISPELRDLTGLDQAVVDAVRATPGVPGVTRALYLAVNTLIRLQVRAVEVAIGCADGQQRSVVIANEVAKLACDGDGYDVEVTHRDVKKPPPDSRPSTEPAATPDEGNHDGDVTGR